MIPALVPAVVMMCAVHSFACRSPEAHRIAAAIDVAAPDNGLRAHLVVSAWEESGFRLHPVASSWDAHAGLAKGPWQLWKGGDQDLLSQARSWLWSAQRGGLAGMCGHGPRAARMAARRGREAVRLLELVSAR